MSDGVHDIDTGSTAFDIVVDRWGDARGVRDQFARSNPGAIDPLINGNVAAYHLATDTVGPGLAQIREALQGCWQGGSADHAYTILDSLQTDATSIGENTLACHDSLVTFQQQWRSCKTQAGQLYEGVFGSGVHEDNSGAHTVSARFNAAMQTAMHSMPNTLTYTTPLSGPSSSPGGGSQGAGGAGGHGYGSGVGGYGSGVGTGGGPTVAGTHIGRVRPVDPHTDPVYTGGNGGVGSGSGTTLAGYAGPVAPPPVTTPPGYTPAVGPVATPVGGIGGLGAGGLEAAGMTAVLADGAGLRSGVAAEDEATLGEASEAALSPELAAESELGAGRAALGTADELESSLGSESALESESGLLAEDGVAGEDGLAAGSGQAGEPEGLGGRGAGRGTEQDEDERTRTTWLDEDEGIWEADSGAPPGVIS